MERFTFFASGEFAGGWATRIDLAILSVEIHEHVVEFLSIGVPPPEGEGIPSIPASVDSTRLLRTRSATTASAAATAHGSVDPPIAAFDIIQLSDGLMRMSEPMSALEAQLNCAGLFFLSAGVSASIGLPLTAMAFGIPLAYFAPGCRAACSLRGDSRSWGTGPA